MKKKKENKNTVTIIVLTALFFLASIILAVNYEKSLLKKRPLEKPAVRPAAVKGRIAIVIDDWGYSLNNLKLAAQIKEPLTCAVLPGLKNSSLVMRKLHSFGFEIILHLPMEPKAALKLEKNTITCGMDDARIRRIMDEDLSSISLAKGISNHMGSRVTEDLRTSQIIITEAKKRGLYFLDSFVTDKSVCPEIARRINVKFARRDIFLDNRNEPGYIKEQLLKLRDLAAKHGVAIGIGHDRRNTLLVLKELLPQLDKEGYKIVFLSEVTQ